jgi:hypothetical protein
LLINPADQQFYNHVTDLDSFRKLNIEAHLGKKWFDASVWAANDLRYSEHAKWRQIFAMIAQGSRYHYFPRGINEIIGELEQHPNLAIEKNLVLIYDRDLRFYLSKTGPNAGKQHQEILIMALENAQKNGLIERLIMKHWSKSLNELNYDGRIKIRLKTPKSTSDDQ